MFAVSECMQIFGIELIINSFFHQFPYFFKFFILKASLIKLCMYFINHLFVAMKKIITDLINNYSCRNVTMKVFFHSEPLTGEVYCAALTSRPINTNIVKLAAVAGSSYRNYMISSSGNVTSAVSVGGMVPASQYTVYCYVENMISIGVLRHCYLSHRVLRSK